jgi:RimJ/RimL family protein N-acetyltransferase
MLRTARIVMNEIKHSLAPRISMQSAGILHLLTARLVLRDWAMSDMRDLIEWLNDLSVSQLLAFVPPPFTTRDAERWLS